jgi:hypothetical protein
MGINTEIEKRQLAARCYTSIATNLLAATRDSLTTRAKVLVL